MERLRPLLNLPFRGVSRGHSFGCAPKFSLAAQTEERLFAFATTERMQPQVFEFANDEEGLQQLANLIRSEEVQAVIKGQRAPFEVVSLVEVAMSGHIHQDRMPLTRGF